MLIPVIISVVLSILIGLVGSKRRIGFGYAILLSLTFSPIISIFMVLASPSLKSYKAYTDNSSANKNRAILLLILGLLFIVDAIYNYYKYVGIPNTYYHPNIWPSVSLGIGFLILWHYLTFLPKYEKPENFEYMKDIALTKLSLIKERKIAPKGEMKRRIKQKLKIKINKKKVLYVSLSIVFILIITNPSQKNFKEFVGSSTYTGLRREQNWIILSVYNSGGIRYLGIFMNFFKVN